MQSRQYQENHINELVQKLISKETPIGQMPTGGGKTVEFSLIAQMYIRGYIEENTNKSVVILVHREELMYQAESAIKEILKINPVLIIAGSKEFRVSRVYIGMVESTLSRLHLMHNVGLVIIDECHVANFNKVHEEFKNALITGFSATPIAASKKNPLKNYYSCIVTGPQIQELIDMKFLSQNITRVPKNHVDSSKFEVDKLKGDYNEGAMAIEYKKPKHVENVIKQYLKFCKGGKTLVFNVSKEHSQNVTDCFVFCGLNARNLDSDTEDRAGTLKWFKETKNAILCSVMIPTVGFDEPTVINVILNFSTLSLVKFIQCCGRGGRVINEYFIEKFHHLYPYELELKWYFNIVDLGGNYERFGDWSNDRDWEYIFYNPAKATEGIAPQKTCPVCEGLVHASVNVCPLTKEDGELCDHVFEKKKTMKEQDLEEMILVTKGIDVDLLIDKYSKKYDMYTFLEMGHEVVKNLFELYPVPSYQKIQDAFSHYYDLCCEWWIKSQAGKNGNRMSIRDSSFHIKKAKLNFDTLVQKFQKEIPKLPDEKQKEFLQESKVQAKVFDITPLQSYQKKQNEILRMEDYAKVYGR